MVGRRLDVVFRQVQPYPSETEANGDSIFRPHYPGLAQVRANGNGNALPPGAPPTGFEPAVHSGGAFPPPVGPNELPEIL